MKLFPGPSTSMNDPRHPHRLRPKSSRCIVDAMGFVLKRSASRVLCFNGEGQLLLIRASDPADRAKPSWWELPGGGIEPGESPQDAIVRELREEAGVIDATIGRCVWTQHAQFTFAGWEFDQHERIYLATSSGAIAGTLRLEAFETLAFEGIKWWNVDELLTSNEPTVPPRLVEFLPAAISGDGSEPVDITPLESNG